jgi:DNA mismatch endonuclease (patch repair protein)
MADRIAPDARSRNMARIRGRDTVPELCVRSVLHGMGFRFRLHRRDLPGTPDVVLPRHRVALFVHGCFWHRHPGCRGTTDPKTRPEFWQAKFAANMARDVDMGTALESAGWRVVVIWECETRDREALAAIIQARLPAADPRPDRRSSGRSSATPPDLA